jgi:RHS repeat-associated protein
VNLVGGKLVEAGERLGLFGRAHGLLRTPASAVTAEGRAGRNALHADLGGVNRARAYDARVLTKDPIDVASGEVVLRQTDVELAGILPLVLERTHISSYRAGRLFGPSWASTLDQRLEIGTAGIRFVAADGMVLAYPVPATGTPVLPESGPVRPLATTADGGHTVTDPWSGRTLHFAGRHGPVRPLTAITERNGHRIELLTGDGRLSEVRHSGGYRIAVDIDAERVTALRLIAGDADEHVLVRYRYDDAGHLAEVIDSSGAPLRFGYDEAGRLTGWDDRNGFWYRYHYDEQGRGVRAEGSAGLLNVALAYTGSSTTVTDSLGHPTTFHFNDARQVVAEVDPLGRRTAYLWDHQDRLLERTDPLGRAARYTYDARGNLVSITRPDGRRSIARYDELDLPTEFVEADGAVWRQRFDDRGNLLTVTDPAGAVTRHTYDELGRLTSVTDALGATTRVVTDPAGLPLEVTDPRGTTTRCERDAFGRVTLVVDPAGGVTWFGWTIEGRPAWRTRPGGATELWHRDAEGNQVEYVDALGRITRTEYGPFDRPVAQIAPDGSRLTFAYDTELRLTAVTNPLGLVWRYEYDEAGDVVRETDFGGRTISYTRDAAGRLTERVNGAGQVTRFAYDRLDNVVERRSGDAVATFAYDGAGRLIRAVNADATVRFDRDRLGRVIAETCNGRTLTGVHDLMGRRVRRRTPSGAEASWRYDGDRPAALRTAGRSIRFERDDAGRETERHVDATTLVQRWDAHHRLVAQTLRESQGLTEHRVYRYRADGAVQEITEQTGGPRSFDLDAAGRVMAVRSARWSERYSYDPAGNITFAISGADRETAGDRDHSGVLVRRAGRTEYDHDGQGRVVHRRQVTPSGRPRTWQYTWDADDRMVSATTPDGQEWRYRYDALGRRIAKERLGGERTDFTWDGPVLAEQVQRGHVTTWDYEPGTFRPIAQSERGTVVRFAAIVTDLVGTPAELIAPDGTVTSLRMTLWGSLVPGGPPAACPLRFPGQYHDAETGLYYNVHRYYDPAGGRYQSPDPLGLAPTPHPYTYVANPTTAIDPLGLAPYTPEYHLALSLHATMHEFADKRGALLWFEMPSKWGGGHDVIDRIMIQIRHPQTTKISFNLTGMRQPYFSSALRVAVHGRRQVHLRYAGKVGYTDFELHQIATHPGLWAKTTFWRDEAIVPNPFDLTL